MIQLSDIYQKYSIIKKKLPLAVQKHLLLLGGTAAFLFGSDRPFSNDIDLLIPEKYQQEAEQSLNVTFILNKDKPIFHSLAAHLTMEEMSFDLVLKSSIQPVGLNSEFSFYITEEVEEKKVVVPFKNHKLYCIPKELLVIMKLMAGRGEELGKYDLYDVNKVLENGDLDLNFLKFFIFQFCQPISDSLPILQKNCQLTLDKYQNEKVRNVISFLNSL